MAAAADAIPVVSVRNLSVEFNTRHGNLKAIDNISLDINRGEVLGIVGESGAGKSLTGNAIAGLIESPGHISGGEIRLGGERIDTLSTSQMRHVRGNRIGMVFQDPLTSLNPLFRVGDQIVETICAHLNMSQSDARKRAISLLGEVGIPSPDERIDSYPHEFSGGMRQRVVIALALCAEPELIIADEPTTALDVAVQAQILDLLRELCTDRGVAIMLVTHDMGVIAEIADRVAVMYSGRIIEIGQRDEVISNPLHPYASGLMGAIPSIDGSKSELQQIPGSMPRLSAIPDGCAFHPRCSKVFAPCDSIRPDLLRQGSRMVACHLYKEEERAA